MRVPLRSRQRGAIYVETLIAFPLVLYFCLIIWQLIDLQVAGLIVEHAANSAARAAAVIGPDEPKHYNGQARHDLEGGRRRDDVREAAQRVLNAHPKLKHAGLTVSIDGPLTQGSLITVKVSTRYECYVRWLNAVCGGRSSRSLSAESSFPYMRAELEWY